MTECRLRYEGPTDLLREVIALFRGGGVTLASTCVTFPVRDGSVIPANQVRLTLDMLCRGGSDSIGAVIASFSARFGTQAMLRQVPDKP